METETPLSLPGGFKLDSQKERKLVLILGGLGLLLGILVYERNKAAQATAGQASVPADNTTGIGASYGSSAGAISSTPSNPLPTVSLAFNSLFGTNNTGSGSSSSTATASGNVVQGGGGSFSFLGLKIGGGGGGTNTKTGAATENDQYQYGQSDQGQFVSNVTIQNADSGTLSSVETWLSDQYDKALANPNNSQYRSSELADQLTHNQQSLVQAAGASAGVQV